MVLEVPATILAVAVVPAVSVRLTLATVVLAYRIIYLGQIIIGVAVAVVLATQAMVVMAVQAVAVAARLVRLLVEVVSMRVSQVAVVQRLLKQTGQEETRDQTPAVAVAVARTITRITRVVTEARE